MKQKIKFLYQNSFTAYYCIRPFFVVYNFFRFYRFLPVKSIVKLKFKKKLGYPLNLKNPQTLNEKLNWLKLYNKKPIHTTIADKYLVRDYVAKKIGSEYLIPLVYHTTNPKDIIPENLPDFPVIIKTNHDSSGGIIIRDKQKVNWRKTQLTLHRLLKDNYYYNSNEWQYKNIKPRVVVEKLLTNEHNEVPYDYKLQFFNGNLAMTSVIMDRSTNPSLRTYDANWNPYDFKWGEGFKLGKQIKKPAQYNKMVELGKKLAEDFISVRVDFYINNNAIYFGELTLYDGSGFAKFTPEDFDLHFGKMLIIKKHI